MGSTSTSYSARWRMVPRGLSEYITRRRQGKRGGGRVDSRAFRDLWPSLLSGNAFEADAQIAEAHAALKAGLALASAEAFYAPLMALAKQEGVVPMGDVRPAVSDDAPLKEIKAEEPGKVAFMGLGAMGRPMSLGRYSCYHWGS